MWISSCKKNLSSETTEYAQSVILLSGPGEVFREGKIPNRQAKKS